MNKLEDRIEKAKAAKERSWQRHLNRQKSKDQGSINHYLSLVRVANKSGSHVGCIRINPGKDGSEYYHEHRKFEVCFILAKWGHDFITEAIFRNDQRADIIDLTEGVIYEVTDSETTEMLKEKTSTYPSEFEIRQVPARGDFREKMLL